MLSATRPRPNPFIRNHVLRDAIGKALYDAMGRDPSIHLFGEGAQVKVHYDAPEIERRFGERVHTLPISEDGNTGFAVGTSLLGVKPVVDVITADFLYRTFDSICNTAAKLNFVSGREHTIVVRAEFLTGGPTTGQRPEALFTHIPGLRVAVPSTPRDAYGLMRSALETPGVTLLFEDRMIADDEWPAVASLSEPVLFGTMRQCTPVTCGDVVVLTYGLMRQRAEQVIKTNGFNVGLHDLRTLYPLDMGNILDLARRCGRVLIIEPDVTYAGVGAEIVAQLAEALPGVRLRRLGGARTLIPASPALHAMTMPTEKEIRDALTRSW